MSPNAEIAGLCRIKKYLILLNILSGEEKKAVPMTNGEEWWLQQRT